jgi:hypothetical protein
MRVVYAAVYIVGALLVLGVITGTVYILSR